MTAYVVRRLLGLVPLLLLISLAVYALVLLLPGDPARAIAGGLNAPESEVAEVREELGLDDPLAVQYGRWLSDAVQGDLGRSLFSRRPVTSELTQRLPVTVSLAVGATVLAVLIAIPAGVLAAVRTGGWLDRAISFGTSVGVSVPDFFLATALVVLLAVQADLLPAIGYVGLTESPVEWAEHLVMAWVALAVGSAATLTRQVRAAMIDVLQQDYVRTARSRGLSEIRVLGKHALKNALTPALTIVGIQFAYLLGGTVIIESIFSLPGLGQYLLSAITSLDLPVIQGVVLVVATGFVVINLVVDLLYGYLNPKVRLS